MFEITHAIGKEQTTHEQELQGRMKKQQSTKEEEKEKENQPRLDKQIMPCINRDSASEIQPRNALFELE